MTHTKINPTELAPLPGVSHAVAAPQQGRTVYVSGQTGVDGGGKVVGSDHRSQSARALHNLKVVLEAAGAGPKDVVRMGIYLVDYDDAAFAAFVEAAVEVFGDELPAPSSTLVGVAQLWQPDLLVEIDAIAVV